MSRRPPSRLYHGTGILQLAEILAGDVLQASPPDDHDASGIHGASLSSDKGVAQRFADEAKDRDWERMWSSPVEDGAILTLDGRRLHDMIGTKAVVWDGSSSEREWRTRGDVRGVRSVLLGIDLDPASCAWWIEALREEGMEAEATVLESIPIELVRRLGRPVDSVEGEATLGEHLARLHPPRTDLDARLGTTPSPT